MASWQIQYWNGSSWVNFENAQIDHTLEELSSIGGQEELVFNLPNTPSNRTLLKNGVVDLFNNPFFVQALFDNELVYPLNSNPSSFAGAFVSAFQFKTDSIKVTAFNYVYWELAQSQPLTKQYTDTPVATILTDLYYLSYVGYSFIPDMNISIKFNNADGLKVVKDVAAACGMAFWDSSDGLINIGSRDSTVQTLGYVGNNSVRSFDYSKQISEVVINGVDPSGFAIQGSALATSVAAIVKTFTEKKVCDVATLNQLAAFKLQQLNNPSNGNSLECLIHQVYDWHPEQYVSANRPDLDLVGNFIIQRITKNVVSCTVEVDKAMPQTDITLLNQLQESGDLARYPTQPQTQIPNNVTLQGLLNLWHLTDPTPSNPSPTTVADSAPSDAPVTGAITNGSWITNPAFPGEKFLSFGGTGYVNCPGAGNSIGGTSAFAIGGWFSPASLADSAELIGKAGCFILEETSDAGAIRFGVHIGGNWVFLTSDPGIIQSGGRCFAMGVYDGSKMFLYVADPSGINQLITYSQAQTGNVDSSSSDVYIGGSGYMGDVAECMIWGRSLSGAEVQALFFRPLVRVV
jgi:hypothetical protein